LWCGNDLTDRLRNSIDLDGFLDQEEAVVGE
jgi:hypothetical protein